VSRSRRHIAKHCHHKASNRGVVCLDGHDHYTGIWGTPEARDAYERQIGEWLVNGRSRLARLPVFNGPALGVWVLVANDGPDDAGAWDGVLAVRGTEPGAAAGPGTVTLLDTDGQNQTVVGGRPLWPVLSPDPDLAQAVRAACEERTLVRARDALDAALRYLGPKGGPVPGAVCPPRTGRGTNLREKAGRRLPARP